MLNKEQVESEEEKIRSDSLQLTDEERRTFHAQFNTKLKDPDTYAALAWSLPVGLHHSYLGEWGRTLLDIAFFCLGLFFCLTGELSLTVFGALLILCISLAELYSLFRAQVIVQNHNNRIMRRILANTCSQTSPFR
ncbi:MAG: hypothetical protein CMI26_05620 [Opitutae bacterium]|nr:hypothetical protein [Opitutae bacterium]